MTAALNIKEIPALPVSTVKLEHLLGRRTWKVFHEEFAWMGVVVPIGYETDLASVPRALLSLFPSDGKYLEACIIHDYIYTHLTHIYTKKQADEMLRLGAIALGLDPWKARFLWAGTRIGGKGNW